MTAVIVVSDTGSAVLSASKPSRSQQMVLDVLIAAHRNRLGPLTAGDIRERLEMLHSPRRFDKGWVTGRLDELRDKDLVEQSDQTRVSPVTKKASHLWFIPARQVRLCA